MRISRRQALQIPVVGAVVVAAGCGREQEASPPPPDPFIELTNQALWDAEQATAEIALDPEHADALRVVAQERTAHADALKAEVARLASPTSTSTKPSRVNSGFVGTVADSLRKSQQSAAAAARNTHGYRAGLAASISAACAVQIEVLLK